MSVNLNSKTHQLLKEAVKENDVDLIKIHLESGLPYHWLKNYCYNPPKDPSVNYIQTLYEYLTNKPLIKE